MLMQNREWDQILSNLANCYRGYSRIEIRDVARVIWAVSCDYCLEYNWRNIVMGIPIVVNQWCHRWEEADAATIQNEIITELAQMAGNAMVCNDPAHFHATNTPEYQMYLAILHLRGWNLFNLGLAIPGE